MKKIPLVLIACIISVAAFSQTVVAGATDPLFINLTTNDPHRANMAMAFGKNQLDRGHMLTIFLNDKAVLLGSTENSSTFAEQRKVLGELVAKKANIIVCPMCMKHYNVKDSNLIPGAKVGNPDITGSLLFKDGTKSLSW